MLADFHFLRPAWLLAFIPLIVLAWLGLRYRQKHIFSAEQICDPHLLPYLIQTKPLQAQSLGMIYFLISISFMILGLAGPAWKKLEVPTYQSVSPHVILLNMSQEMQATDLAPNRLTRAKFKLHDLFQDQSAHGQFGFIAYTSEPFVVSPLTDDINTLDALLPMLTTDIMPVTGNELSPALEEAKTLVTQAGFDYGKILVITSIPPSASAINNAGELHKLGYQISLLPIIPLDNKLAPEFKKFTQAGGGILLSLNAQENPMKQWLSSNNFSTYFKKFHNSMFPEWQDEGKYFIIFALLALIPLFRKGAIESLKL